MRKIICAVSVLIAGIAGQSYGENIELWGTSVSPYVRKVVNVLDYKKLGYHQKEILPLSLLKATGQDVPEDFQKATVLGKIPLLTLGSQAINDSSVIAAYLEKEYPGHAIYPKDSGLYADALWLEKYSDTELTEAIHPIFIERVVKASVLGIESDEERVLHFVENKLPKVLSYLNNLIEEKGTYALVGDQLSIADFAVVNQVIDLDASKICWRDGSYPALEKYMNRMMGESFIQKTISSALDI